MPEAHPQPPEIPEGAVKPKGQWHHGNLRESLIHWGTQLLDTQGIDGMSLRATARLAGVSPGAPAHHFSDKDGLLAAIASQGFRDLIAMRKLRLNSVPAQDHPARLRAVLQAYVEFAQAYPARFELMFGPLLGKRDAYPDLADQGRASFGLLREVVLPLLPPRPSAMTEDQVVRVIWSAVHGLTVLHLHRRSAPIRTGPRQSIAEITEALATFSLLAIAGLHPAAASSSSGPGNTPKKPTL